MPVKKLQDLLDRTHVHYEQVSHSPAYTAQEIAQMAHIPGREMAKTVIVKLDGRMVMLVLPANRKVALQEVRDLLGADRVQLAAEDEFEELFPECEPGAMPPFGNLYGMPVYVAPSLAEDEEIAFNAGSHTELLKMRYSDFARLVNPQIVPFTN